MACEPPLPACHKAPYLWGPYIQNYFLSPVNLSYTILIIRLDKEPKREEGKCFPPIQSINPFLQLKKKASCTPELILDCNKT